MELNFKVYLEWDYRKLFIVEYVVALNPDMFGLQEVAVQCWEDLEVLFRERGYRMVFREKDQREGIAVGFKEHWLVGCGVDC